MEHPATFLCRKPRVSLLRVRLLTLLRYVREFKLYNLRRRSPRRGAGVKSRRPQRGTRSGHDIETNVMNRPKNFRVYFLLAALAIGGVVLLLREHRPSFLRPDLHLSAYVTTADGSVTVVDLVKLKPVARIPVGPGLSGMREHPTRPEVFGVSTTGGYVWILDPRINQVTARIAVGPLPYALDFSPDGNRIY